MVWKKKGGNHGFRILLSSSQVMEGSRIEREKGCDQATGTGTCASSSRKKCKTKKPTKEPITHTLVKRSKRGRKNKV